jgi:hypothetical protein
VRGHIFPLEKYKIYITLFGVAAYSLYRVSGFFMPVFIGASQQRPIDSHTAG